MKKSQGFVRGFHHFSAASYYEACKDIEPNLVDRLHIGFYSDKEGGTLGEFRLDWINNSSEIIVKLVVFDDAFEVFNEFLDLVVWLKDYNNSNLQPSEVIEMLLAHGVKDFTKRDSL